MLSESESDGESLHRLTINEHYAKAFKAKKEREELEKLKAKYGSDAEEEVEGEGNEEDEDSEEHETEDEDGEQLTPTLDAAILRTLARIKRKDPEIYDSTRGVFQEEQCKIGPIRSTSRKSKDKSRPVTIRQVALESALHPDSRSASPEPETHEEEQRALRDETIAAFHTALQGDDGNGVEDDDDTLLVPREKTKDEMEKEEEEYREFLQREVGGDLEALVTVEERGESGRETAEEETVKKQKRKKKKKRSRGVNDESTEAEKDQKTEDQKFLMDYILNRGWIDRSNGHIPTYKEVVGLSSRENKKPMHAGDGEREKGDGFSEDEFDELAEDFETSYNFRFEEPDAAMLKTYPRNIPSLVRREDTSRKDARERRKLRKEEEVRRRREEVRRLKRLKMNEIKEKLQRIGREGGKHLEQSRALQELDLEAEWDPDYHDRQMAEIYEDDGGEDEGNEKPHWEDDIDISDIVPQTSTNPSRETKDKRKKRKKGNEEDKGEGVDVAQMDADVEPAQDDEKWDGTEEMRKQKWDQYMDEVYGLGFNDVVGGMPTRFKYTPVEPSSFALTPVEILMATDAELNQYVSLKKYASYQKRKQWDQDREERLRELRLQLKRRGASWGGVVAEDLSKPMKKRRGKKERNKSKVEE